MLVSRVKAMLHVCELIHSVIFNSFAIPRTVDHQAPLSIEFTRQEYCSGLPFPPARDLPNPGIEPCLLHCQADSTLEPPRKPKLK